MHNRICRHVTCASGNVKDTGAGCELHAKACTCTPLNVELSRDLIIGVLLCIYTRLQPHNRVECVLAAGADKSAPVCNIWHPQQRRLLCARNLFISSCISEYPRSTKSSPYRCVLHNGFLLVLQTYVLRVRVLQVLYVERVTLVSQWKTPLYCLLHIVINERTHSCVIARRVQHIRFLC